MPGIRCCVVTCNNKSDNTRNSCAKIMYHRFPNNSVFKEKWIEKCGGLRNTNVSSARVCSIHFRSHDYKRDLKSELLKLPTRKVLKETAIPSRFVIGSTSDDDAEDEDDVREQLINDQNRLTEGCFQEKVKSDIVNRYLKKTLEDIEHSYSYPCTQCPTLKEKLLDFQAKLQESRRDVQKTQAEYLKMEKNINKLEGGLESAQKKIKILNETLRTYHHYFDNC